MALSAGRAFIVDLTSDSDTADNRQQLPPPPADVTQRSPARTVPLPAVIQSPHSVQPTRVPLPGRPSQDASVLAHTFPGGQRRPSQMSAIPTARTSSPAPMNPNNYAIVPENYVSAAHQVSDNWAIDQERAAKRLRISQSSAEQSPHPLYVCEGPNGANTDCIAQSKPLECSGYKHTKAHPVQFRFQAYTPSSLQKFAGPRTAHRAPAVPSVQSMNEALKPGGANVTFLDELSPGRARTLQIGRVTEDNFVPHSTGSGHVYPSMDWSRSQETRVNEFPAEHGNGALSYTNSNHDRFPQAPSMPQLQADSSLYAVMPHVRQKSHTANASHASTPLTALPIVGKDSIMSDMLSDDSIGRKSQRTPSAISKSEDPQSTTSPRPASNNLSTAHTPRQTQARKKYTNQFSQEEDHYLIFLKEVKRLQWKQITAEFNKEFPGRTYATIQTHYSQAVNTRDRSLDPPVLKLPQRYADEANIDWVGIQASLPAPRPRAPREDTAHNVRKSIEDDTSSRSRPRRAAPVNYTWPRERRRNMEDIPHEMRDYDAFDVNLDEDSSVTSEEVSRGKTPSSKTTLPRRTRPLQADAMQAMDAGLALHMRTYARDRTNEHLPYLAATQRQSMQQPPEDWEWVQDHSHHWQEGLIHVDFSPEEVATVHQVVSNIPGPGKAIIPRTGRSKLRDIMRNITDAQRLRIADRLRRALPARNLQSIEAFLQDARRGVFARRARIYRITNARKDHKFSTCQDLSTLGLLRRRELGQCSRRGWQAPSRPITYTVKNKYMDTLGPSTSWIGASSDVHAVAWSPNGETFAAAAIAVDDPDSQQYNRPNNLLYGDTDHQTIRELAEHYTERRRTEKGANSTHAMFASQDPRVFNTVSSVAFSTSGRVMYSAGYDGSVCLWKTAQRDQQPDLAQRVRIKAQIDMLTVHPKCPGIVAIAAKISQHKAIRLLGFDEDSLYNDSDMDAAPEKEFMFRKTNFCSSKAVSRADLKILPTALKFEPNHGHLLLTGFGANVQDSGFDITGEICLWDIASEEQLHIHGSNKNVFDVAFNPNRRCMPLFAAACVAGANVNRGVRSIVRLYDLNGPKFTCPLEIECKALDINDIVWCPYDERLIAVGCTDGKAYVWDVRQPTDPISVLSHGPSLMPLQDGIKHEITDTGMRFLSWGDNATRLYSGSSDGVVKIWDVTRSTENSFVKDVVTFNSGIMSGEFNNDMSKLLLGEVDGAVNVLEIGKDDISLRDMDRLRYIPYVDDLDEEDEGPVLGLTTDTFTAEMTPAMELLQSGQLQTVAMGSLPIRQVVQGPNYTGPYDQSDDASILRQQAIEFQRSLATPSGPQCDIASCGDNYNKITTEETGDSGRSTGRIPDQLQRTWRAVDQNVRIVAGKPKCKQCGRSAQPPLSDAIDASLVLCERCAFACLHCGTSSPLGRQTEQFACSTCKGAWDIGVLGYENVQRPAFVGKSLNVPNLKKYGEENMLEKLGDFDAVFGDEMNALTEHYFAMALDRPESLPL